MKYVSHLEVRYQIYVLIRRLQRSVIYQVHYTVQEKFHLETLTAEGKGILPLVKENTC